MIHILFVLLTTTIGYGQSVTFQVSDAPVADAKSSVGIRGSVAPLSWDQSIPMKKQEDGSWLATVDFTASEQVQFKFVVERKGDVTWELGSSNRNLNLNSAPTQISRSWNVLRAADVAVIGPFTEAEINEDFQILKNALMSLHPGLYRYNTEESLNASFDKLHDEMLADPSVRGQYKAISLFLASIQCGHTYANFYNQPAEVKTQIHLASDKLPVATHWIDKSLYITHDVSGNELPAGTEILSIDGNSSNEILERLIPYVKSDGNNDGKRIYDLGIHMADQYESFDMYYPLEFPIDGATLNAMVLLPDGTKKEVTFKLIKDTERRALLIAADPSIPASSEDTWSFEMVREDVAVLKLGTFSIWNFELDWKKFINNAFATLRKEKIPNLIIDIRGNEGGADEVMAVIGRNMVDYSCGVKSFESKVKYQKLPSELRPYVGTWDTSIYDLSKVYKRYEDGLYVSDKEVEIERLPSGKGYDGNVFVIIDESNSSATMLLSRYIKECGYATLVGRQTGGSRQGINGGAMYFVNLPNTRIEFDIPVYGMYDLDAEPGGVEPDVYVEVTRDDLIANRDPFLEAVFSEIDNP